ncbi:hypothetical protein [Microvirga massiliensis]|uniref:hypothetical protein n=1 Tax=Microvirga massiliensis TaxID=1033741 RepID=UPI00062BC5B3|nr:hypothetical protein [Microvirga massiliensis]
MRRVSVASSIVSTQDLAAEARAIRLAARQQDRAMRRRLSVTTIRIAEITELNVSPAGAGELTVSILGTLENGRPVRASYVLASYLTPAEAVHLLSLFEVGRAINLAGLNGARRWTDANGEKHASIEFLAQTIKG